MSDTIFREEVKNAINATLAESIECEHSAIEALTLLRHEIMALPSAEKTGKWLITQRRGVMLWNEKAFAECSVCHEVIFNARSMKFCPQCGARMEV